jgi:pyruvate/2-oxoacid:ferredoxin oxidoreductase beta subunit
VETGIFPLYEIEKSKYRLTYNPEPLRHVIDYMNGQGRFRHLTVKTISSIQGRVSIEWERLKFLCGIK